MSESGRLVLATADRYFGSWYSPSMSHENMGDEAARSDFTRPTRSPGSRQQRSRAAFPREVARTPPRAANDIFSSRNSHPLHPSAQSKHRACPAWQITNGRLLPSRLSRSLASPSFSYAKNIVHSEYLERLSDEAGSTKSWQALVHRAMLSQSGINTEYSTSSAGTRKSQITIVIFSQS